MSICIRWFLVSLPSKSIRIVLCCLVGHQILSAARRHVSRNVGILAGFEYRALEHFGLQSIPSRITSFLLPSFLILTPTSTTTHIKMSANKGASAASGKYRFWMTCRDSRADGWAEELELQIIQDFAGRFGLGVESRRI